MGGEKKTTNENFSEQSILLRSEIIAGRRGRVAAYIIGKAWNKGGNSQRMLTVSYIILDIVHVYVSEILHSPIGRHL